MTASRSSLPPWRPALLVLAALGFAVANLINALNKGGDFQVFVESGRRVLEQLPLYEGSSAGVGVVGPPFQGLFFAPFALIAAVGMPMARVAWYAVGLASLLAGVAIWSAALDRPGASEGTSRRFWTRLGSASVLVPLLAILFPAQTNFEHQNMNPLLLACLGAAAYALRTGRERWAGGLIGAATALKAYPGLLLLYFVYRRAWRGLAAALITAAALSLLPAIVYGPSGLAGLFEQWLAFSTAGGWPDVGNNQSLVAMIERLVGLNSPLVTPLYAASVLLLLGAFAWAASDRGGTGLGPTARAPGAGAPADAGPGNAADAGGGAVDPTTRWRAAADLALLTLIAVLASPIAWDHYWVLMFPAFFTVYKIG
ncbi:MAG: glycosyltransferase family 87 protein, partial [Vicinamibacterales bacterium]